MAHLTPSSIGQIAIAIDGISISAKNLKLGHDSIGTGVSDFTSNRFLYLDTFNLNIGSDTTANHLFLSGSDGRVGIGTSSPSSKVEIHGGSATTLLTLDTTNAQDTGLDFKNAGTRKALIFVDGDGTDDLVYRLQGTAHHTFQTAGGTYTPLTLRGDTGFVGINISTPTTNLHVKGGNMILEGIADQDDTAIYFQDSAGQTGAIGFQSNANDDLTIANWTATGDLRFITDLSIRKIITDSGLQLSYLADNLTPAYDLAINGTTSLFRVNTTTAQRAVIINESSVDCDFRVESDTLVDAFFLQGSSGKIGINNATLEAQLHIKGISNTNANNTLMVSNSDNKDALTIVDDLTSTFVIPANKATAFNVNIDGGTTALKVDTTTGAETVEVGSTSTDSKTTIKSDNLTVEGSTTLTGVGTASVGSTQHNYVLPNADTSTIIRLNNSASFTLTGIAGGSDGKMYYLFNVGIGDISITHQSVSSDAANRIICPTNGNFALRSSGGVQIIYDGTAQRWRIVSP